MSFIKQKFTVAIDDINLKSVCRNKAILRFLETVACVHSDIAGYGAMDIERNRATWVLLAWKMNIFRRPRYGEEITVVTWARNTGKASTHRDFEILDKDENVIGVASSKWALLDIDKMSASRSDGIIAEHYDPEEKHVFEEAELKRLALPENFERQQNIEVMRRDIDLNNHVHNLTYLDYAYEIIPTEIFASETDRLEINYKTQARLGDELTLKYAAVGSDHYVAIINAKTGVLCASVKLSSNN
jgi:acyl-ACP thioesterase